MSAPTRTAWIDGRFVPWAQARLPIEDRGLQFAESLYEVLPITAGRARMVDEHAERMRRGAVVLELQDGVPPPERWREIAGRLVDDEQIREGLLYAQLTGGTAKRGHVADEKPRPTFLAYLMRHRFPRAADTARGIRVITVPDMRWARCDLKTTMLLPAVLARREAVRHGADEAFLLGPSGEVREGSTTNVFIVEGRTVCMPPQDAHRLPGTTQPLLLEAAARAGLEVTSCTLPLDRVLAADEVFVTATSRLAMPVIEVDGRPIGAGGAGPVARDLAGRLRVFLELEEDRAPASGAPVS